jgi:hypothetical protein
MRLIIHKKYYLFGEYVVQVNSLYSLDIVDQYTIQ